MRCSGGAWCDGRIISAKPIDLRILEDHPLTEATFDSFEKLSIVDAKFIRDLQSDFADWIYRTQTFTIACKYKFWMWSLNQRPVRGGIPSGSAGMRLKRQRKSSLTR
jgi:hypothetical protein